MTDLKGWATAKALEAQFRLNELETQASEAEKFSDGILLEPNTSSTDWQIAEDAMYDLRYQYRETAGRLAVYREVLGMLEEETVGSSSAGTSAAETTNTKDGKQQEDKPDNAENVANGSQNG